MGEWRDMSTAPRDGDEVLLLTYYYYPGDRSPTVGWYKGYWMADRQLWDCDNGEMWRDNQLWRWCRPELPAIPPRRGPGNGFEFPLPPLGQLVSGGGTV